MASGSARVADMTIQDLRSELANAGREAMRAELELFKASLIQELKNGHWQAFPTSSEVGCHFGEDNQHSQDKKSVLAGHSSAPDTYASVPMDTDDDENQGLQEMLIQETNPSRLVQESFSSRKLCLGDQRSFVHTQARNLVQSNNFNLFMAGVIVCNVAFIGVQVEYAARTWTMETPPLFSKVDGAFLVIYLTEIALRIYSYGLAFFYMPGCGWNLFDLSLVTLMLFETGASVFSTQEHAQSNHNFNFLRLLRVIRMLRVARFIEIIPELRTLIVSITDSLTSLLWTLVLIMLMTYAYGVVLTQIVTDHKIQLGRERMEEQEILLHHYGTLEKSMLTLYQTISDGVHWGEIMEPLAEHCSPWLALAFVLYMAFVLFAMMNTVTAFFVESALRNAAEDTRKTLTQSLMETFQSGGVNTNGITEQQFEGKFGEETMQNYLKVLGLDPRSAKESRVFDLIDSDGSGSVDVDELIDGAMKLTGPARAIDLHVLMRDHREEINLLRRQLVKFDYSMRNRSTRTERPGVRAQAEI